MKPVFSPSELITDPKRTACFSGHRPEKMPFNMNDPKNREAYLRLIYSRVDRAYQNGYRTFITGMARGFDILAAFAVIRYEHSFPAKKDITLIGVSPFRNEIFNLKGRNLINYTSVRDSCDKMIYLCEDYHSSCFHVRNHFMIDHSSLLISSCILDSGGTASTLRYAKQKGLMIDNIGIDDLKSIISFNDTSEK